MKSRELFKSLHTPIIMQRVFGYTVDVEATHRDRKRARIIKLAAINAEDPTDWINLQARVAPRTHTSASALVYNGFTPEELVNPNLPTEAEVIDQYLAWRSKLTNRTASGHNPETYDIPILEAAAARAGMTVRLGRRTVDLHSLAAQVYERNGWQVPLDERGFSNITSDQVSRLVNIPPEPKPHREAMHGVIWEREALERIIHRRSYFREFAQYAIPKHLFV